MPHFKEVTRKSCSACLYSCQRNTEEVVSQQSDLLELEKRRDITTLEKFANSLPSTSSLTIYLISKV
jgi:hypothetical protein